MSARVLDGAVIGAQICAEVALEVKALKVKGLTPGLAVVMVGHDPAAEVYANCKMRAAAELDIFSTTFTPPATCTTEELLGLIAKLNARDDIDGILVQWPLPRQIDINKILPAINPAKDVDGFHPLNVGCLSLQLPSLLPCTAAGCIEILERSGIAMDGAEAVVLGHDMVARPVAMLLTNANATVTVAHSRTRNLADVCRRADIIVVAMDKPGYLTPEMVRPGATVIDGGLNRIEDRATFDRFFKGNAKREASFAKSGHILMGDADPQVAEVAGAITPVPGGMGPLTLAVLLSNTVKAAKLRRCAGYGLY